MKHTPSPWYAVEYAGHFSIQSGEYYSDPDILRADRETGITYEQAQCNALLVIKAPIFCEYIEKKAKEGCSEAKEILSK